MRDTSRQGEGEPLAAVSQQLDISRPGHLAASRKVEALTAACGARKLVHDNSEWECALGQPSPEAPVGAASELCLSFVTDIVRLAQGSGFARAAPRTLRVLCGAFSCDPKRVHELGCFRLQLLSGLAGCHTRPANVHEQSFGGNANQDEKALKEKLVYCHSSVLTTFSASVLPSKKAIRWSDELSWFILFYRLQGVLLVHQENFKRYKMLRTGSATAGRQEKTEKANSVQFTLQVIWTRHSSLIADVQPIASCLCLLAQRIPGRASDSPQEQGASITSSQEHGPLGFHPNLEKMGGRLSSAENHIVCLEANEPTFWREQRRWDALWHLRDTARAATAETCVRVG
nr:PREDICTED: uncharacterized protein LOC104147053 [Struthio camelus australis]